MFDRLINLIIELWNDFKPIIFVLEYKEGILMRKGRLLKIMKPGAHFKIPFLDDYHLENVKTDTMKIAEVNITTLDGHTAIVGCQFELRVVDMIKATIETNDWRTNLQDICQGILSDLLEEKNWEDIKKKTTKNAISKRIEARAEEMGITTSNFNFTDKVLTKAMRLYGVGNKNIIG